jgi:hypothetical protein
VPTTLVGAVIEALAADATLSAQFPGLPLYRDEIPEQVATLPHVVVSDRQQPREWVTESSFLEKHTLTLTVWAKGGGVVGAAHPAEAVAAHAERILDWQDVPLAGAVTVEFRQTDHTLTVETRRAPDKERVGKCVLAWAVTLGYG